MTGTTGETTPPTDPPPVQFEVTCRGCGATETIYSHRDRIVAIAELESFGEDHVDHRPAAATP
jgi:hypothetical protein